MKKMRLNFLLALLSMALLMATSCKKDDDDGPSGPQAPELGTDFEFDVNGNDVTFTTTLTGSVWFTNVNSGVQHQTVDGEVVVNLPQQGEYPFTCTNLLSTGEEVVSDTFTVEILQDDLSFLDKGMWKHLTGGSEQVSKTWRMDMRAEEPHCVHFAGPLFYSGADGNPYWAWDVTPDELPVMVDGTEMTQYFNWSPAYADNTWLMPAVDYGTITFNGADGTITVERFGETCEGSFAMDTAEWTLTVSGCTIPIDTARLNEGAEGQFPDLNNLRIFSISDSALQIGVKRQYEGLNDDGSQVESPWTHVYNFVVDDYEYPQPEQFTYEEPVLTSFTQADLEGTWVFADVAQDWIGWKATGDQGTVIEGNRLNTWSTRDDMASTLAGWGANNPDSVFTAADSRTFTFNGDGTCNLNGTETTYSVSNGVITFGTDLTNEFGLVWVNLTGTEVKALDVQQMKIGENQYEPYSYDGIWIGIPNPDKPNTESSAVHLVKQ